MVFDIAGRELAFEQGDITKVAADAIVNAANSGLLGGGGVDGAIHRTGGPSIMRELDIIRREVGKCPTGQAVVTGAGDLPADWVIHAVGPMYRDGASGEAELLTSCYNVALRLAQQKNARRVTTPSISTGVYGYPMQDAARVAISAVLECLRDPACRIEKVTFVLFGEDAYRTHVKAAETLLQ
jgi:O-acetyl-ADP-ribose deacetylase (regulator of RNase III)